MPPPAAQRLPLIQVRLRQVAVLVLAIVAVLFGGLAFSSTPGAPATIINVVDAPYNADGDCATDATIAIQDALDDAADLAPAAVRLGGPCFLTSSTLTLADGVTLIGEGRSLTTLLSRQSSGPILHLTGTAPGLESLRIDGSSQSQDTHAEWGAWLDHTSRAEIDDIEIWQTRDSAVLIIGGDGNTVTNSVFHGMGWNAPYPQNVDDGAGIYVSGRASNTAISGDTFKDMNRQWTHCLAASPKEEFDDNGRWSGLYVSHNTFANCGLRGYAGGNAIVATSGAHAEFIANDISDSPDSQLWTFDVAGMVIDSNQFYNADGQHAPGVEASGGLAHFEFLNNTCISQDRCLWMYASALSNRDVIVKGNTVREATHGTHQSLHLSNIEGGTIWGNSAVDGCVAGLYMTNDSDIDVQYNVASGCTAVANLLENSSNVTIRNNRYDGNTWPGGGVVLGGVIEAVSVNCNDLSNNGFGIWNFSSGTAQVLRPNDGVCSARQDGCRERSP
jgi:parallel beta helix pectate lyase-like protein